METTSNRVLYGVCIMSLMFMLPNGCVKCDKSSADNDPPPENQVVTTTSAANIAQTTATKWGGEYMDRSVRCLKD
jgi:hypothetical protein